MRLGVFGGTFDPVHVGHLILAERCREDAGLDQVLFVPAARPPHKTEEEITPFAQRVEMLALAVAGQPSFVIDPLEKDRVGPSYTADTLGILRQQHPEAELFLIIGSDSLHDFPTWYRPARIAELATLLVVQRPDWPIIAPEEIRKSLPPEVKLRIIEVTVPLVGISSSDIRRRVSAGRSIRYLVPRPVEVYVQEKRLYTAEVTRQPR
jgi:nicotinate-nucleotide adenylyltransferase